MNGRSAGPRARSPHRGSRVRACRRLAAGWAVAVLVFAVVPVSWVFGIAPVDEWTLLGVCGHFFEFALLTGLVAVGWRDALGRRRALTVGAAISAVYGVVIEVVQLPLSYRHFDVRDMATDWAGVATAALLVSVAGRAAAARSARTG